MRRARAGRRSRTFPRCARCRSSRSRRSAPRMPTPRARRPSATASPKAYHDYGEMFASSDIDVVSVVVRAPNHHEVVMAALEAGKPVYCEWPLGVDDGAGRRDGGARAREGRTHGGRPAGALRSHAALRARPDRAGPYRRRARGHDGDDLARPARALAVEAVGSEAVGRRVGAVDSRHAFARRAVHMRRRVRGNLRPRSATQIRQWKVSRPARWSTSRCRTTSWCTASSPAARSSARTSRPSRRRRRASGWRSTVATARFTSRRRGAVQRDANKLMGAQGRAALAPMDVPASYAEAPRTRRRVRRKTWRRLPAPRQGHPRRHGGRAGFPARRYAGTS